MLGNLDWVGHQPGVARNYLHDLRDYIAPHGDESRYRRSQARPRDPRHNCASVAVEDRHHQATSTAATELRGFYGTVAADLELERLANSQYFFSSPGIYVNGPARLPGREAPVRVGKQRIDA